MSGEPTFWARRRAAVAAEEAEAQKARQAEALAEEHSKLEDQSDAEILEQLDLPDPDDMQMGDDFTAFMAKAVPDRIRRRALRKLWLSNPVLANVDMLVDYGEDFTDSATVIENLQTTYQVGKGMLKHVQEMARQEEEKARALEERDAPDNDIEEIDEIDESAPQDNDMLLAETTETPADPPVAPDEERTIAAPTPRRMKFKTQETAA